MQCNIHIHNPSDCKINILFSQQQELARFFYHILHYRNKKVANITIFPMGQMKHSPD